MKNADDGVVGVGVGVGFIVVVGGAMGMGINFGRGACNHRSRLARHDTKSSFFRMIGWVPSSSAAAAAAAAAVYGCSLIPPLPLPPPSFSVLLTVLLTVS